MNAVCEGGPAPALSMDSGAVLGGVVFVWRSINDKKGRPFGPTLSFAFLGCGLDASVAAVILLPGFPELPVLSLLELEPDGMD